MSGNDNNHHGPKAMTIFYTLMGLTFLTVATANWIPWGDSKALPIIVAMAIATVKGTLVVQYFMHLKFEMKRFYFTLFIPLLLLAILIFALVPDIAMTGS